MKNTKNRWAGQDGNFLIISVVCLVLLGFLFVIIQDVLRRNSFEQELQKLADDTALYAAAMVPSVSVCSYLTSDTEIRPYMAAQNYGIGSHILSAADASYVDAYALQRAEEYVKRAAMNSASSNYFGGNLVMTRVNPKFSAYRLTTGRQVMDYYVQVELKTRWGGTWFGSGEDVAASAIAKATIDYKSLYTRFEVDPDSYVVDNIFANGIYGRGVVDLQNWGGAETVCIVGDVHSEESILTITYAAEDSVSIYGTLSAPDLQVNPGAIDYLDGDTLEGAASPTMIAPVLPKPNLSFLTAAQIAQLDAGVPVILSSADTNYKSPIIVWPNDYGNSTDATGNFPPNYGVFLDPVTGLPYTGGTFYTYNATGAGDGSIHLTGTGADGGDANIVGNWCFVTDGDVHMNNLRGGITGGDLTNDVFFNIGGTMHMNNIKGPVVINGSIMAPNIAINNSDCDFPFTIYGGLYATGEPPASGKVNLTAMKSGFTLIHKSPDDAMPPALKYPIFISSTPPNYSSPRVILIH